MHHHGKVGRMVLDLRLDRLELLSVAIQQLPLILDLVGATYWTDNIASLESTSARKSVSVVPVTVEQNKNENKFDLIDRFSQIFKKKVTAVEDE